MKFAKAFLLVFLLLLLESLFIQSVALAQEPEDTVWIVPLKDSIQVNALKVGASFRMSVEVSNSDTLYKVAMALALKDTGLVQLDSITWSDPTCLLNDTTILDVRVIDTTKTDTIVFEFLRDKGNLLPDTSGKFTDLWFTGIREGVFFIDTIDPLSSILNLFLLYIPPS